MLVAERRKRPNSPGSRINRGNSGCPGPTTRFVRCHTGGKGGPRSKANRLYNHFVFQFNVNYLFGMTTREDYCNVKLRLGKKNIEFPSLTFIIVFGICRTDFSWVRNDISIRQRTEMSIQSTRSGITHKCNSTILVHTNKLKKECPVLRPFKPKLQTSSSFTCRDVQYGSFGIYD